jgi:hypothetical protein
MKVTNYEISKKLAEIGFDAFEPFLEVENEQDALNGKKISDQDWLNIKNSAEKVGKKLFEQLRQNGYYLT